jgi:CheY-like chemotaxis protein
MEKNRHILVVDDEASFRYAARIALRMAGYRVSEAQDGEDALNFILRARQDNIPIDLMLLDLQMPRMSGLELLDTLNELGVQVPVLAVSGFADDHVLSELHAKGYPDLLHKPFDPTEMVVMIEAFLGNGVRR